MLNINDKKIKNILLIILIGRGINDFVILQQWINEKKFIICCLRLIIDQYNWQKLNFSKLLLSFIFIISPSELKSS